MEKKKNFTPIIVMLIVLSIVAIGFGVYNSKNCGVISNALGLAPSTGCVNPSASVTLNVGDKVCDMPDRSVSFGACRENQPGITRIITVGSMCVRARNMLDDSSYEDLIIEDCSDLCIDGGVQKSIAMTSTSCTATWTRSCLPKSGAGDDGGE